MTCGWPGREDDDLGLVIFQRQFHLRAGRRLAQHAQRLGRTGPRVPQLDLALGPELDRRVLRCPHDQVNVARPDFAVRRLDRLVRPERRAEPGFRSGRPVGPRRRPSRRPDATRGRWWGRAADRPVSVAIGPPRLASGRGERVAQVVGGKHRLAVLDDRQEHAGGATSCPAGRDLAHRR